MQVFCLLLFDVNPWVPDLSWRFNAIHICLHGIIIDAKCSEGLNKSVLSFVILNTDREARGGGVSCNSIPHTVLYDQKTL